MSSKFICIALLSTLTACSTVDQPDRGVASVNVPVVTAADYVFDASAPGGALAPDEGARLDGWFQGLGLGYGDTLFVDGGYAPAARTQIAAIASRYGMAVSAGAPVTAGMVRAGAVRVVVSRRRASVPNCPNWSSPASPNFENRSLSNFGCAENSNIAAMVANPEDLLHGREASGIGDPRTGTKAIDFYRSTPPTGTKGLKDLSTKKDSN